MAYTSRIALIKMTIKQALEKEKLFLEDDVNVTIFEETTTVDLPVLDSSGNQKETTCEKGDILIQYIVNINGHGDAFVMAEKTLVIHAKRLGYDLKQIKRLCLVLTNQNDECVEHCPWL
tara:strand:- start:2502 stop:2858 length:357 start_codon:yes stop_codon:yes gene_type:complete